MEWDNLLLASRGSPLRVGVSARSMSTGGAVRTAPPVLSPTRRLFETHCPARYKLACAPSAATQWGTATPSILAKILPAHIPFATPRSSTCAPVVALLGLLASLVSRNITVAAVPPAGFHVFRSARAFTLRGGMQDNGNAPPTEAAPDTEDESK